MDDMNDSGLKNCTIGFWSLDFVGEAVSNLYVDNVFRNLIGADDSMSQNEVFEYWNRNVADSFHEIIDDAFEDIANGKKVTIDYRWNHPVKGEMTFRCVSFRNYEYKNSVHIQGSLGDITEEIIYRKKDFDELDYSEIVNVLSSNYETIYCVNTKDNSYVNFHRSGILNAKEMPERGKDFFADSFRNISEFVFDEDVDSFRDFMMKNNLLDSMLNNDQATFEYRLKDENGEPVHYRMRAMNFDDGVHIIVAVENIEDEIRTKELQNIKNLETKAFIEGLSSDFEAVYVINPDRDTIMLIRLHEDFDESLKMNRRNVYSKYLEDSVEKIIVDEDKDRIRKEFSVENILAQLKKDSSYLTLYKVIDAEGNEIYHRAKFAKVESRYDGTIIILGIRNVDGEVRQEIIEREKNKEINSMVKILSGDYNGLYYVNVEKKESHVIWVSKEIIGDTGANIKKMPTLQDVLLNFTKTVVHPDDRIKFSFLMEYSDITRVLAHKKRHSVVFRRNFNGDYRYNEMIVAKAEDFDDPPVNVAIGFMDIDDEYRIRLQQEAIIQGIANDFEYVAYIEIDNNNKEIIHRRSELFSKYVPDWELMDNFSQKYAAFAEYLVVPEDREKFLEAKGNYVIKELESNSAVYTNFRINIENNIYYYQIKYTADKVGDHIVGVIVGFHSVDESTKNELRREAFLAEANEEAEKTIAKRTAELRDKNRELERTNEEIVEMLGDVVEMRDKDSGIHIQRVKAYTYVLANMVKSKYPEYHLSHEDIELITSASALHDVGKIMISDAILLKPGKLSDEEYEIMKTHSLKGCEILQRAPKNWSSHYLEVGLDICHYHHEKWDGNGYPEGLKGDEIPISAQIVSVADCFDALTTKRVYKEAYSIDEAYRMICEGECGAFSDKLLYCFKCCRKDFERAFKTPKDLLNNSTLYISKNGDRLYGLRFLIVDDSELSLDLNKDLLESEGAEVVAVSSGEAAISEFTAHRDFDAIIMDLIMPGMNGIEAIAHIRKIESNSVESVPIIALTAEGEQKSMELLAEAGADASMAKPLVISELTRTLFFCMRQRTENMERKLVDTLRIANTDPLTKVKNIAAYTDMVAELTSKIKNNAKIKFGIVMCDVNNLKHVNDGHGHDYGDTYIKNCCSIICHEFSHSPVYRIGGDEFVVVLQGEDYENRDEKLVMLRKHIAESEKIDDYISGKASLASGMAIYDPNTDRSVADIVKRADKNMYENKKQMKVQKLLDASRQ